MSDTGHHEIEAIVLIDRTSDCADVSGCVDTSGCVDAWGCVDASGCADPAGNAAAAPCTGAPRRVDGIGRFELAASDAFFRGDFFRDHLDDGLLTRSRGAIGSIGPSVSFQKELFV